MVSFYASFSFMHNVNSSLVRLIVTDNTFWLHIWLKCIIVSSTGEGQRKVELEESAGHTVLIIISNQSKCSSMLPKNPSDGTQDRSYNSLKSWFKLVYYNHQGDDTVWYSQCVNKWLWNENIFNYLVLPNINIADRSSVVGLFVPQKHGYNSSIVIFYYVYLLRNATAILQ